MFRIITAFTETPAIWMVCDNRTCGVSASAQLRPDQLTAHEKMRDAQGAFIAGAVKDGWQVGLDSQLCPQHVEQARAKLAQIKEAGKKVVTAATLTEINRFKDSHGVTIKPELVKG